MRKRTKYALIAGIIVLAGAGFFWSVRYWPVMRVEGEVITYSVFLDVTNAIRTYQRVTGTTNNEIAPDELRRQAFMNLIERRFLDVLISRTNPSLFARVGQMVEDAIARTPGLELEKAAQTVYGVSGKDFKEMVLLPQAKRQLLIEYYKGRDVELEAAWDQLYNAASVKIYYPGYEWENGEVVVK